MARAKTTRRPSLIERTSLTEWTASGLGLAVILAVLGYLLWEALLGAGGPPDLHIETGRPHRTDAGHVVPLTIRNASRTTSAAVEVRGVLEQAGAAVEERRAVFAYVPGRGRAHGGLVFQRDPADYVLRVEPEGFEEP